MPVSLKAGFHMIADDRGSRIADRRSQKVQQTFAIIWKHTSTIVCDPPILSSKARIFACNNRLFVVDMAGAEQGNVSSEEFMEEVARYECVYHRNSKDFTDKNKKANCWKKSGRNLIYQRSSLTSEW